LLSLLKLLKPELRTYHDSEDAIFKLVSSVPLSPQFARNKLTVFREMADHLEQCATDPSHQPAIYAAFIREIVRKTKEARNPPPSAHPSRPSSPGGEANGTIDPSLTKGYGNGMNGMTAIANANTRAQQQAPEQGAYDPALLDDANWSGMEPPQFTFIPQGGDMM
jgi:hypothetical protein